MTDTDRIMWCASHRAVFDFVNNEYLVSFVTVIDGVKQYGSVTDKDVGSAIDKASEWRPSNDMDA